MIVKWSCKNVRFAKRCADTQDMKMEAVIKTSARFVCYLSILIASSPWLGLLKVSWSPCWTLALRANHGDRTMEFVRIFFFFSLNINDKRFWREATTTFHGWHFCRLYYMLRLECFAKLQDPCVTLRFTNIGTTLHFACLIFFASAKCIHVWNMIGSSM